MDVAQDQVLVLINKVGFLVGFLSPEHENHSICVPANRANHCLCEVFPALLLVRVTLAFLDGEDRI